MGPASMALLRTAVTDVYRCIFIMWVIAAQHFLPAFGRGKCAYAVLWLLALQMGVYMSWWRAIHPRSNV